MDTRRRSIAKALSWRVFATLITFGIAYAMTGQLAFAAQIGALDTLIKLVTYFAHERVWVRIRYGRIEPGDYRI